MDRCQLIVFKLIQQCFAKVGIYRYRFIVMSGKRSDSRPSTSFQNILKGMPAKSPQVVDAERLLWAEKVPISIPALASLVFTQRSIVALLTALCGFW